MKIKDKKSLILTIVGISSLVIMAIGATFAYFQAQGGNPVTRDVNILTHTVDTLTFSISNDIEIEASQFDFASGGQNKSANATVTAVLSPNSKTGNATDHYYITLYIPKNEIIYSNMLVNVSEEYYDSSLKHNYTIEQYNNEINNIVDAIRIYVNNNYTFNGPTYNENEKNAVQNILSYLSNDYFGLLFSNSNTLNNNGVTKNVDIWDFNNNRIYNGVSPLYLETDAETGASFINTYNGVITDDLINILKECGWFDLIKPELMIQVFDDNNDLVQLSGLGNQKTVKGLTGYDITGVAGLIPLLENQEIATNNNLELSQEWRVVMTLINHDYNQNVNTNKAINGKIIVSKEQTPYFYWQDVGFQHYIYSDATPDLYQNVIDQNGISTVFLSSEDLLNYTENLAAPIYIRTTGQYYNEVCLWYNNHEYCYTSLTDAIGLGLDIQVNLLKNAIEDALNITLDNNSCNYDSTTMHCDVGDYQIAFDSNTNKKIIRYYGSEYNFECSTSSSSSMCQIITP